MMELFRKKYDIKLPKSQHETEEFPSGKGLVMCENCKAVRYKKHWHHNLERLNLAETLNISAKDVGVKFELCPACLMIKNRQYEGRVKIKNVLQNAGIRLDEIIKEFGEGAYRRDPMHRIIGVEKNKLEWTVTMTENQLANKLAKKIKDVFPEVQTKTHFAGEGSDVAETVVEFSSERKK